MAADGRIWRWTIGMGLLGAGLLGVGLPGQVVAAQFVGAQFVAAQGGEPPAASSVPDPAALARALEQASDGATPAPRSLPAPPPLRLGIAPDLAEAAPALIAALKQRSDIVITAPFDYGLATIPDFPQTLFIAQRWSNAPREDIRGASSGFVELGNLVLGDYQDRLEEALQRRLWLHRLLALDHAQGRARGTTTCLSFPPGPGDEIECDLGDNMATLSGLPNRHPLPPSGFAVRNDSPEPRFLYLIDIDPDRAITVIPLTQDKPVPPGQWAVTPDGWRPGGALWTNGRHSLITLASALPIPAALREGRNLAHVTPADCSGPLAAWLCGQAGASGAEGGWSASASHIQLNTPVVAGIGNGFAAAPKQAPWMAQIYSTVPYKKEEYAADDKKPPAERAYLRARHGPGLWHRCGGTRIAFDLVLTAAHCVAKGSFAGAGAVGVFAQRRVRTGTINLSRGGVTYAIDGLVVHGGYDPKGHRRDIALLHLKADLGTSASRIIAEPDMSGPGVKPRNQAWLPAEVPGFRLDPRTPVKAYGWGFTETLAAGAANIFLSNGEVQQNPDELQFGDLQTLDSASCLKRMGAPFDNKMLCVITGAESARRRPGVTVFTCVGDSGGPLIRRIANRDVLVGITAWSRGCGNPASASVYTAVAAYKDWIAAAIAQIRPGQVLTIDDNLSVRPVAGVGAARR